MRRMRSALSTEERSAIEERATLMALGGGRHDVAVTRHIGVSSPGGVPVRAINESPFEPQERGSMVERGS